MGDENMKAGSRVRGRIKRTAVIVAVGLVLYVSSFFTFRLFRTYEFSLMHPSNPQHNMVVFSTNPNTQQLACDFYSPLIAWFPGHRYYPDRDEMQLLNSIPTHGES